MQHRITKLALSLAAAAVLTAGTALAQSPHRDGRGHEAPHHGGPPSAEQQLARLHEQLQLTDQQSIQLLEVLQAREEEHEALRARMMEQMRPEICSLMQDTEADILAVLTPEQGAQFLELQEDRRARALKRGGRGKAPVDCE